MNIFAVFSPYRPADWFDEDLNPRHAPEQPAAQSSRPGRRIAAALVTALGVATANAGVVFSSDSYAAATLESAPVEETASLDNRIAAHFAALEAGVLATDETMALARIAAERKIDFSREDRAEWAKRLVASVGAKGDA